jgi:hypothetical protein
MWNMTSQGFTSMVAHRTKRDSVLIRSRDRESLEYFCRQAGVPENKIHSKFPSDYPYRAVVKKKVAAQWAYDRVMGIEYDNFKDSAAKVWGHSDKYVTFLHAVWAAGQRLTPLAVPTITELLELTPDERNARLEELELVAEHDKEVDDLLNEVHRLLSEQAWSDDEDKYPALWKSLHDLTDEEFAQVEAEGKTV